ncbi:heme peroxidase family protein [Rhodothermus marinus]|uniref:peroxidase family protein n=1 Tax=Rhodothermus marinus TaxID=29549 RepID=UPI0037C6E0BF
MHRHLHHGLSDLPGLSAFCHYGHPPHPGNRFGRLFPHLPPLYLHPESLSRLGRPGGPMDGGTSANRTHSVAVGYVFFGQFVDHDITLDVTSSLSSVADPAEVPNIRTPTLDLDCIYGLGPEASPFLYHAQGQFAGIKLLTGADGTAVSGQPPALAAEDLSRTSHGIALIGDPRNDENRIISQLQLAMHRFHNHVVEYLHNAQGLEGHELFEEARRLTTWHYQWVIVEDFLPRLCGKAVVDDILGNGRRYYRPEDHHQEPYIPVEFSVAAYRFGHSMIPQRIQVQQGEPLLELFGAKLGHGFEPLRHPEAVVDWHELVETPAGRHVQQAEKLDTKLAHDLLQLPFISDSERSLATRNLLRGQAFLLPSGEQVAHALNRPDDEIERVHDAAQNIAGSDVDFSRGTPLWFYILTEAETIGRETRPGTFEPGEGLGPVGARLVAEVLIGLLELDTRSYLSSNRNWRPVEDGVGVTTLGDMLTYHP